MRRELSDRNTEKLCETVQALLLGLILVVQSSFVPQFHYVQWSYTNSNGRGDITIERVVDGKASEVLIPVNSPNVKSSPHTSW